VDFVWGVPLRLFSWLEGKSDLQEKTLKRFLTSGQVGRLDWNRTYRPFDEHTGLFMTFADLTPEEDDILGFANKYGSLLAGYDPDTSIWLPEGSQQYFPARGETQALWQREIQAMRLALNIWNALRSSSSELLASLFNTIATIAQDSQPGSLLAQWLAPGHHEADVAALQVLARLVEQHLQDHVASRMRPSEGPLSLKLSYAPRNLLGALWLQLAFAIDANKNFVACTYCGDHFELSDDRRSQRSAARYCGAACRVNAYRERVAQAQKLHAQKMSYREIAKQLGTTTERIKKWVPSAT